MMALALAFGAAFLISFLATPMVGHVAARYGFADKPNPRRSPQLKPRLGGVAMYLAFALAIGLAYPLLPARTTEEIARVIGLLSGGLIVLVLGAVDDKYDLPVLPQLGGQILAAAVAVGSGILIDKITDPLTTSPETSLLYFPVWLAVFFTFFWLMGAMNTINFLDGIDGLAAGVVAVAALVLALHSWILGQVTITLLPLALAGACIGFLPFNFHPAKITMGTSGSLFLGFSLGALSIIGGTKAATLLLVLGPPVVDTGWTILRRLLSGHSPFQGDRSHLHHRLLALGLSEPQIVLLMYGASLFLGCLALLLSTRLAKLYALGIMAVATVLLVGALAYLGRRRLRGRS